VRRAPDEPRIGKRDGRGEGGRGARERAHFKVRERPADPPNARIRPPLLPPYPASAYRSAAYDTNRVWRFLNQSWISPVGPLRCLASFRLMTSPS